MDKGDGFELEMLELIPDSSLSFFPQRVVKSLSQQESEFFTSPTPEVLAEGTTNPLNEDVEANTDVDTAGLRTVLT
ncbi:hypothetical protein PISMIDRAFT_6025 [Pisolithus microcarpus 441]|uniref:Uncharacterized protein n=1 Tax=Pisolithus microcarpus 441 TaxID=765257 RepID=A0A0C9ZMJ3_9AGAM|nr:hypothetical protein PISMIDRAFT_6025 [Pisolithus microcarpus 441]